MASPLPASAPAAPSPNPTTASAPSAHNSTQQPTLSLTVTFTGGLAPTFGTPPVDTHKIQLPYSSSAPPTAGALVQHLTATFLANAPRTKLETFVLQRGDAAPRPGILVLVNDADWELEGGEEMRLEEGDTVLFVSTLHGG